MIIRVLVTLIVLVAVGVPTIAHAGTDEKVEAAIERGYRHMQKGKFEEALDSFRAAYKLAPGPRTIVQIAFAESALGLWAEAEGHLLDGLRDRDDPWVQKNDSQIQQALAKVEAHIARVAVHGSAGAQVSINGEAHGVLPLPGPVRCPAGPVTVGARAPGFLPFVETVEAVEGKTVEVVATLKPDRPLAPIAAPVPLVPTPRVVEPASAGGSVWLGSALVVAGAAGMFTGGYFLGRDGKPSCEAGRSTTCPTVYDGKLAGWLFVVGGLAATTMGGILLLLDDTPTKIAPRRVALLIIGPSTVGLMGQF